MTRTKRADPSNGSRTHLNNRRHLRTQPRAIALAVGAALLPWAALNPALAGTSANSLPTGVQTIAGSATVTTSGTKMQIDQSSGAAILGAQTWSIGSDAWVNMTMPGASSTALVRVLGSNPSEILGRWTANGQVFLTNPNGVFFGRSASVEVGSLFATTLSIADKDFLAGRYNFHNAGGAGSVINQGHIVTANGYTALAGPQVRNDGIIVANAGTVALAAGDRVSLDMIGDGLIHVSVDQAALNASAINSGSIQADGGTVLLTARSANALLDTVVNNSGIIRANSLVERNGAIVLDGGAAGVVSNTGTLSAAGVDPGTTGGTVKALGERVALLSGTRIDVSGDQGGGVALIGGDYQGKNPDVRNATYTTVAADATISADAGRRGDGGKVIVWADDTTRFAGQVSARGGSEAGNGGFVEVSGKHGLALAGLVGHFDLSAPRGHGGELLLDPNVINVDLVATSDPCLSSGTCTASGGSTTLSLQASDITAFLSAAPGNNLTLKTNDSGAANDNININTALTTTNIQGNKLTLDADDFVTGFGNIVGTAGTHFTVFLKIDLTGTVSKTYDATSTATLGTANYFAHGLIQGDSISNVTQTGGAYNDKNAGTSKLVTSGTLSEGVDYTLTGTAANYTLPSTASGNVGTIAKLDTNISGTRVYDASGNANAADFNAIGALIPGDTVTISGTGSLADKNVGLNKAVTNGTLALGGVDGGNYNLLVAGNTMTVTKLDTNISGTRVYDATTNANAADFSTIGALIAGDTVTISGTGSLADKNAGVNKAVTNGTLVLGGADAGNYNLLAAGNTMTVTKLDTNISGTRVYDATINANAVDFSTIGALIAGDTVTISGTGSLADKNLGVNKAVSNGTLALGGADAGNYNLLAAGNTMTVTKLDTNISGTRVYDGTANASAAAFTTISALLAGDTVNVTGLGALTDKNVGANKPVANGTLALSGADGGNYNLLATGNTLSVTRLASVSAVTSGLWSSASTWQGGAVPDNANVANVDLNGFSVTFDNTVANTAGTVNIDSLVGAAAGSKLTFSSGNQLQILTSLNLHGYSQSAGIVGTGTTFTVTNNFNQTGGLVSSLGAVNITQAAGALTAFDIAGSSTTTLTANTPSGDISLTSGGGLSGTTVTLTAGRNVALNSGVNGSSAVNINFGQQVAGTFTPVAAISGTTTITGGTSADLFDFSGAPAITATLAGGAGGDTLRQSGAKTWTLNNATANAGTSGGLAWSAIENLSDTGAGNFNMGTAGSVAGTLSANSGSVNYASYAAPVTFNLSGAASTGMAGWNGITSVTGSAGSDTITGSGQTYTITGSNAANNASVAWTSIENLTDLSAGTLRATSATWTLNGLNTGSVTNLSGAFAGMGNLADLGTGTFNMHGSANGSISGNLSGGANGTMNYAGYTSAVTFSLAGAAGTTTGVGGARAGVTSVIGSATSDTITGSGATYNLTSQNAGNSGGLSWSSFENISDAAGGTFNLSVGGNNVTGTLSSGGIGATLNSTVDITALNLSVPSTLTLTGTANNWNLAGAPQPTLFQTTNPNANVIFNGACIGGPACGTVIAIVGSISSTVSQIASQALKDAQSTDSVAKQIDYGFAGDVGTTPPMDHRIDETGISTPDCLEESREARPCKN